LPLIKNLIMNIYQNNALHINASEAILTFNLSKDKADIILIALRALDALQKNRNPENKEAHDSVVKFVVLDTILKFIGLKIIPENLETKVGRLYDEIWEPYFDEKIKECRTAEDLFAIQMDELSRLELNYLISELQAMAMEENEQYQ